MMSELGAHVPGRASRPVKADDVEESSRRRNGLQARQRTGARIEVTIRRGVRQGPHSQATLPQAAGSERRTAQRR